MVIKTIQSVFELYGFQAIETPVMENLNTLAGKYGDEGDKLLFKVLNSGDYLSKVPNDLLAQKDSKKNVNSGVKYEFLKINFFFNMAHYCIK